MIESVNCKCPDCQSDQTEVTAIVSVFRYERPFYECRDCGQAFAGSWLDISDSGRGSADHSGNAVGAA